MLFLGKFGQSSTNRLNKKIKQSVSKIIHSEILCYSVDHLSLNNEDCIN